MRTVAKRYVKALDALRELEETLGKPHIPAPNKAAAKAAPKSKIVCTAIVPYAVSVPLHVEPAAPATESPWAYGTSGWQFGTQAIAVPSLRRLVESYTQSTIFRCMAYGIWLGFHLLWYVPIFMMMATLFYIVALAAAVAEDPGILAGWVFRLIDLVPEFFLHVGKKILDRFHVEVAARVR